MAKLTPNQLNDFMNAGCTETADSSHATKHYRDYLPRFNQGNYVNWNWAAALFWPIWAIYRCLPILGLAIFAGFVLSWSLSGLYAGIFAAVMAVVLGVFGDSLYLATISMRIRRGKKPGHGRKLSIIIATLMIASPLLEHMKNPGFSFAYTYTLYARMLGWKKPLKSNARCGRIFPKVKIVQNKG